MSGDRSVSDVLQDIVRNVQEIVRSEVRLAKTEIRNEATLAVSSALWLAAGVMSALSAWMFLLWAVTYGLANVMPMWGATLLVAVVVAALAGGLVAGGTRRFKRIRPIPERTVETMKENVEWMKQSAK